MLQLFRIKFEILQSDIGKFLLVDMLIILISDIIKGV